LTELLNFYKNRHETKQERNTNQIKAEADY